MYGSGSGVDRRRPEDLAILNDCPAALQPKRSKGDFSGSPIGVMWSAIMDALRTDIDVNNRTEVRALLDRLEIDQAYRPFILGRIDTYLSLIEPDEEVIFSDAKIDAAMSWTDPSGRLELYRLPSALRQPESEDGPHHYLDLQIFGPIKAERSALLAVGMDPGDSVEILDLFGDGDSHMITPDLEAGQAALEELSEAYFSQSRTPRPGMACFACNRPAFCGAYPIVGDRRPGTVDRLIMVSKSGLEYLDRCERRVAWRLVQGVRTDRSDMEDQIGTGTDARNIGIRAHNDVLSPLVTAQISGDDLDQVVETLLASVPASEQTTFRHFIDMHLNSCTDLEYREAEFPIGFAVVVDGHHPKKDVAPVTVAFYAQADAVGYERDGTPAAIDHKTGETTNPYEHLLYAVGLEAHFQRSGKPIDQIAVHHHYLGREEAHQACERTLFDTKTLREARETVIGIAHRIAAWDPVRPTASLPKEVWDNDCRFCPYKTTCQLVGGPQPPGPAVGNVDA